MVAMLLILFGCGQFAYSLNSIGIILQERKSQTIKFKLYKFLFLFFKSLKFLII